MKTAILILTGALIGLSIPLLCDWMMFGTLTPCRTISSGAIIQNNIYNSEGVLPGVIVQECRTK